MTARFCFPGWVAWEIAIQKGWFLIRRDLPQGRPLLLTAVSFRTLPDDPLLKSVPQGKPANPVYLPAPREVIRAGMRGISAPRSRRAS